MDIFLMFVLPLCILGMLALIIVAITDLIENASMGVLEKFALGVLICAGGIEYWIVTELMHLYEVYGIIGK